MIVLLMIVTILATLALFGTLIIFLIRITAHLDSIGTLGRSSLAMVSWGVRAIESETAMIPVQVTHLNEQLTAAAGGLTKIDEGLVVIAGAAAAQEGYR